MTKKEKENLNRFPMSDEAKKAYFSTMTREEALYFINKLKAGKTDWDGRKYSN